MPTRLHTMYLLLSVLAVLSLTACGSDRLSKREYEEKVRSEYADVQEAFAATVRVHGEELTERIEAAQQQLRDAADALEESEPPDEVEEENEEVVEGMKEYADDLDELRDAAAKGDQRAIDAFNDRLAKNEAVAQIAEAAEEMKFKGYDLGPIAEE
jgi:vacuolar-type H+-ATPase subunit I/STV1